MKQSLALSNNDDDDESGWNTRVNVSLSVLGALYAKVLEEVKASKLVDADKGRVIFFECQFDTSSETKETINEHW